jgi:hypothetical protein
VAAVCSTIGCSWSESLRACVNVGRQDDLLRVGGDLNVVALHRSAPGALHQPRVRIGHIDRALCQPVPVRWHLKALVADYVTQAHLLADVPMAVSLLTGTRSENPGGAGR